MTSTTTVATAASVVRVSATTTVVASSAASTVVSATLDEAGVLTWTPSWGSVHLALASGHSTGSLYTYLVRNWLILGQTIFNFLV